jgi:hypothetical protein
LVQGLVQTFGFIQTHNTIKLGRVFSLDFLAIFVIAL